MALKRIQAERVKRVQKPSSRHRKITGQLKPHRELSPLPHYGPPLQPPSPPPIGGVHYAPYQAGPHYGAPTQYGQYGAGAPNQYGAGAPNQYGAGAPNQYGAGAPNQYGAGVPNQYGAGVPNQYGANQYGAGVPNLYGANQYGAGVPNQYGAGAPNQYVGPNQYGDVVGGMAQTGGLAHTREMTHNGAMANSQGNVSGGGATVAHEGIDTKIVLLNKIDELERKQQEAEERAAEAEYQLRQAELKRQWEAIHGPDEDVGSAAFTGTFTGGTFTGGSFAGGSFTGGTFTGAGMSTTGAGLSGRLSGLNDEDEVRMVRRGAASAVLRPAPNPVPGFPAARRNSIAAPPTMIKVPIDTGVSQAFSYLKTQQVPAMAFSETSSSSCSSCEDADSSEQPAGEQRPDLSELQVPNQIAGISNSALTQHYTNDQDLAETDLPSSRVAMVKRTDDLPPPPSAFDHPSESERQYQQMHSQQAPDQQIPGQQAPGQQTPGQQTHSQHQYELAALEAKEREEIEERRSHIRALDAERQLLAEQQRQREMALEHQRANYFKLIAEQERVAREYQNALAHRQKEELNQRQMELERLRQEQEHRLKENQRLVQERNAVEQKRYKEATRQIKHIVSHCRPLQSSPLSHLISSRPLDSRVLSAGVACRHRSIMEPPRTSRMGTVRLEPVRVEPVRVEHGRVEPRRVEPGRVEMPVQQLGSPVTFRGEPGKATAMAAQYPYLPNIVVSHPPQGPMVVASPGRLAPNPLPSLSQSQRPIMGPAQTPRLSPRLSGRVETHQRGTSESTSRRVSEIARGISGFREAQKAYSTVSPKPLKERRLVHEPNLSRRAGVTSKPATIVRGTPRKIQARREILSNNLAPTGNPQAYTLQVTPPHSAKHFVHAASEQRMAPNNHYTVLHRQRGSHHMEDTTHHPQLNHAQLNHAQLNHAQLSHAQLNHEQLNHEQLSQQQQHSQQLIPPRLSRELTPLSEPMSPTRTRLEQLDLEYDPEQLAHTSQYDGAAEDTSFTIERVVASSRRKRVCGC
ncbi:hypothetical protein GNI_081510 [Gregarina niphandrodes]|uniref:Uncharacterized protein n=1 Tax=Gregarina niphandrodes TaxID=110365 RepID=A0A023B6E3_GRENI|nr:hypothetical protein GNI_081510 [Gregarina niphandrodes]EZG65914.1 hypothetical protein GNI_081510 [Gregarina niphandrodes]|eukprot:XP_011134026.1 hypothetical protein GNI_081510 [Gregarina niphandrodes]